MVAAPPYPRGWGDLEVGGIKSQYHLCEFRSGEGAASLWCYLCELLTDDLADAPSVTSSPLASAPPLSYTLTGVLIHSGGSLHSGHYTACVRDRYGIPRYRSETYKSRSKMY